MEASACILSTGKLRQENHQFQVSLSYTERKEKRKREKEKKERGPKGMRET